MITKYNIGVDSPITPSESVEYLGISEDDFGRDRMRFVCPQCGKEQESFRYV